VCIAPPYQWIGLPQPAPRPTCRSAASTTTVFVVGDLDLASGDHWYDECVAGGPGVRVDLGAATFMDCRGDAALTAARRVIEARGGTLVWRGATSEPAHVLEMVRRIQAPDRPPIGRSCQRAEAARGSRRPIAWPRQQLP
jgi:anti-anti-sigma regulatory factor